MNDEVTVQLPLYLSHRDINAVRNDPLCCVDDKDEMNMRIGWLICAYDAIVNNRLEIQP